MSREFRISLEDPENQNFSGAFVINFGNGIEFFETDEMRLNLENWRASRDQSDSTAFSQYLIDLMLGNFSNSKLNSQESKTNAELQAEFVKFCQTSEDVLDEVIKKSNGKLHKPTVEDMIAMEPEIDLESTPEPLPVKKTATAVDSFNKPSPSQFGLTQEDVKQAAIEFQSTKIDRVASKMKIGTDKTAIKSQFPNRPSPPKPEDFGITADTLIPPSIEKLCLSEPLEETEEKPFSRPPRPSDFGIGEDTMLVEKLLKPVKSASQPSVGTPKIARPTSGTPNLCRKVDQENEWTPQNRFKKHFQPRTPITPLTPLNRRTPGLLRTQSDSFQITPLKLNKVVMEHTSSPLDSPCQTIPLKMPPSYKSPMQMMESDFKIKPVNAEEFAALPSFLKIGINIKVLNEALLFFGTSSSGDRSFKFTLDSLDTSQSKLLPLLRRLGRINLIGTSGEFTLV